MTKELKLAVATFPAFAWNASIAEDLRADLLELQLGRELSALGGKIIHEGGELKIVQAQNEHLELYDADYKKVDLDALYGKVQAAASFKGLTVEGQPKPAPAQPGQMPEPKTTNESMLKAYREAREAIENFRRGQQQTQEFEQRLSERPQAPAFTGKYENINKALAVRKQAAEESLAEFKRAQGQA